MAVMTLSAIKNLLVTPCAFIFFWYLTSWRCNEGFALNQAEGGGSSLLDWALEPASHGGNRAGVCNTALLFSAFAS